MLAGLDDIAWDQLDHAYGTAEDVPDMVRAAASDDPEEASEGIDELFGSVLHQGSVYTSTPAVLPFLMSIVTNPEAHHRGTLAGFVGAAAEGDDDGSIKAVLDEHLAQLYALLADEDAHVREMAAFALGHLGDAPLDRLRWQEEQDPMVRASILAAACHIDLDQAQAWLPAALAESGPVQAAAAYLTGTNDLPWSAEATQAVVNCHADGDPLEGWVWDQSWLGTLMSTMDSESVRDVTAALIRSHDNDIKRNAVYAAGDAMHARRSLPPLVVPLLAPLLADPDESTRRNAAWQIEQSGQARLAADELAALAASSQGPANPATTDPRASAICALIEIGDPRWRAPVLDGRPLDRIVNTLLEAEVPVDGELLTAVRARFAADPSHNERIGLVRLLGSWGPAARDALPDVLASMEQADRVAPAALKAIAPDAHAALDPSNPRAARVVYELTGDASPLLKAVAANLDDAYIVALVADLGEAARPLVPALEELLAQQMSTFPQRSAQVEAAKLHWSIHHDLAAILPAIAAALRDGDTPAVAAAEFASQLPDKSLVPLLEDLLTDEWAKVAAARALWRLTGRIETETILEALEDGWPWPHKTVAALVEMRATDAIDTLAELAECDERVVRMSNDTIRQDDRLRVQMREAVRALQSEMSSR
jgi:HEAT repeat